MKPSKGAVIQRIDANNIQCVKCGNVLNILKDYDFYDLNRSFEKECCGIVYILTQQSYTLNMIDRNLVFV